MGSNKTTRDWALSKLDACLNANNRSQEHAAEVADRYGEGGQEEIALALVAYIEAIEAAKVVVSKLREVI